MIFTLLIYAIGIVSIGLGLYASISGLREMRRGQKLSGSLIILVGLICMGLGAGVIGIFKWYFQGGALLGP